MKNTFFILIAIAIIVSGLAFRPIKPAYITGKIIPTEAVKDVWAVSPKDTTRALIVQGSFTIPDVKPGTYKVVIDAAEPYKDVIKDGVIVTEGVPVDMGEIKLEK
jgi:hypothetical protein